MAQHREPKQWQLTRNETITSYESWRQNLVYILTLDPLFDPFLAENFTWQKKTAANPNRGLQDDGDDVPANDRRTAVQKSASLDLMLGQIANFCPVIARNAIVEFYFLELNLAANQTTLRISVIRGSFLGSCIHKAKH